ncbi:STAS domain-containing protein [Streptomyces sp. A0642]|uniref:SulP family inorganic anion transporter n=1 Tax=Streptomyces sp. A0642 TaxID=2563100 RepID=UPI0010A25708|nr:SulP family inorganic anion transporter [Streptomyces sp. A0642]THA69358.1 STAS domain-containing protein [Streptomyces sp. A0642]
MSTRQRRRDLRVPSWMRNYRKGLLRGDMLGALTAWALIVPESVAYAQIAGVPPQNAFYAAPVALLVYALFGRSNFLIIGATSAAAVLSAAAVSEISGDPKDAVGLSAALAVIVGVVLLVAGVARLGFLTNFLAEPALVGFLFGMALTIVVRQGAKLVGVSSGDGNFFERLWTLLSRAPDWSLATLGVGAASLALLFLLERFVPRLPAALMVLVLGLLLSAALGLKDHGVDVVGKIPSAVPVPHLPGIPAEDWIALATGALGVALVVFAEAFSIANRFAREHGQEVDADREMTAVGLSNIAVGLVRGFVVSGSASRSAAATGAGGRTPLVSLIAAALILLTGAFLTPLFTDLPEPVLGAIVIVAVRGFMRVGELRRYAACDRRSLWVALTALIGVLLFDLLPGLLLAVALSLVLFIAAASRRDVAVLGRLPGTRLYADTAHHPDAATTPGVLAVRPDGSLFFGNVNRVRLAVRDQVARSTPPPRAVVLDLTGSYRLGIPVLDALDELREELARKDIALHLAHVRARAEQDLARHALADRLGPRGRHPTVDDAASAATVGPV